LQVLSAKDRAAPAALACWGALAAAASEEQVSGGRTPHLAALVLQHSSSLRNDGPHRNQPSPHADSTVLQTPFSAMHGAFYGAFYAGTLLPTAVRMLRRNPEPALAAAAPMLASIRLDLSTHVAELWPALLQQSRHAKEAVRWVLCKAGYGLSNNEAQWRHLLASLVCPSAPGALSACLRRFHCP
jgi:hypothetical protein